jgi:hypothetical protein
MYTADAGCIFGLFYFQHNGPAGPVSESD